MGWLAGLLSMFGGSGGGAAAGGGASGAGAGIGAGMMGGGGGEGGLMGMAKSSNPIWKTVNALGKGIQGFGQSLAGTNAIQGLQQNAAALPPFNPPQQQNEFERLQQLMQARNQWLGQFGR